MRLILDPQGRWIGRPGRLRRLLQDNQAPIAIDDPVSVLKDSGPVTIDVLANDVDPEGGALTLVSAYAALGTAVAEADNTITYTPPAGVSGDDTLVYEIADDEDMRDTAQVNVTITEPALSIDKTAQNTLTVTAETGIIDITVTDPAIFAGTYQADTDDLAGGPVNLVPPAIGGTAEEGATLTAADGLWIFATAAAPVAQSWQWRRGGSDIPGATAATHVVLPADAGQPLGVVETLSDAQGQRSALSATVGQFLPSHDTALLGWWDAADIATISGTGNGVSTWADKAGGAALTQNTGSREPRSGQRTLNGLNVLDFDGARFMERSLTVPASGDIAFHVALAIDSTASAFAALLALEATNDFQIDANSAPAFDGRLNATGIATPVTLSGGPFSGPLILSAVFDFAAGQAEVWIANTLRATTAYSTKLDVSTAFHVMTNRSRNAFIDGAVAEILVTQDVSVSNRTQHHQYLSTKWGLV